jgi:tetratricopeptide (TPR) repeat protein
MKKIFLASMVLFIMALPMGIMAADDPITEAKALCKLKTLDGYKKAADIALKAVQAQPQSYDANWVTAKALRFVGEESKKANVPGWKAICKENGKKAMGYAEKAISLEPNKVDGYFWYGCSVGTYSDGVSILTALKEGLKDKTQKNFEMSYKLDKSYPDQEYGPGKALGRFWYVLPWPLNDKKKSLTYLEEFNKNNPNDAEGQFFLGELYVNLKEKDKAKAVLTKAAAATAPKDKYFADQSKKLLADL